MVTLPSGAARVSLSPIWFAIAIAAVGVAIFWNLGTIPLLNPDETRNASIAADMQRAGNWLVPTYNGFAYLDKPAFFFKASALSLSLFGDSAFAARLPSALFALGTLALVYAFCRREYDAGTAVLAVAVVGTTPLFLAFARCVIFDMTLAFFVCGAIFAGYFAESAADETHRARWSMLSAAAMGFAALVKGPVGFIVPLLVLGIFHRIDGRRGAMKRLLCGRNLLIFLALFLPWFIGASLQRHDFPYYGVVFESLQRFTTTKANRTQPFYFYLWVIPVTMVFWGLLLPQTLFGAWRSRAAMPRADRLLVAWAIAVTAFFSISQSKLAGYVLTGVIALGILVARRFAVAFDHRDRGFARAGGLLLALVGFAAAAAVAWYVRSPEWVDAKIRLLPGAAEAVIALLHPLAVPATIALAAAAGVSLWGAVAVNARAVFLAYLVYPLIVLVLALPIVVVANQRDSDEPLARHIERIAPAAEVACYRCFPPGIPFYLGRNITVLTANNGGEIRSNYVRFTLDGPAPWPENMVKSENLAPWLAQQTEPVFLLATANERRFLDTLAAAQQGQVVAMTGGRYWGLLIKPSAR